MLDDGAELELATELLTGAAEELAGAIELAARLLDCAAILLEAGCDELAGSSVALQAPSKAQASARLVWRV